MPKLPESQSRRRMINFRISQQEYDELAAACAASGVPSVSAFARRAVMRAARATRSEEPPVRLSDLDRKLARLDSSFGQLLVRLGDALAAPDRAPAHKEVRS